MAYKRKKPDGKHYKVSIRKYNKLFAKRGLYPLVVANIYKTDDTATIHFNVGVLGKLIIFVLVIPLFIPLCLFLGLPEVYSSLLDIFFNERRGNYSKEVIHKRHSKQWAKLLDLIGD